MTYLINEHFYSLQGEGAHAGMSAYFLRLSGCSVGCAFCDSKNAWDKNAGTPMSIEEIVKIVKKSGAKNAVITGGEPFEQNVKKLHDALLDADIHVFIETSGTVHLGEHYYWWITLSPKKHCLPHPGNYIEADELKVIIETPDDFAFAEEQAKKVRKKIEYESAGCLLFLQPEWSVREEITPKIIEYIKKNSKWRLSLQTHKFLGIE